MPAIKEIDPATLVALRAAGEVLLIDVRTDAEVARGMIPGAAHIVLQSLPTRFSELDPQRPTVIYCQSGARSAQACGFLAARGFADLTNLQGGVLAWARAGYPLDLPS